MAQPISELSKTLTEDQLVDYVGKILEEKILKILPKKIKLRNLTAAKLREMKKAGITGPELEAMESRVSSVASKIKKLKRGLGGVILTNPEHYKKTGLFKRILSGKRGTGASILTTDNWFHELDSALGSWDSTMHTTGASNRFNPVDKVGHHRTALSVMRDALLEQPEGVRARFKALALADGYEVGEEFVDYIDPVAHKGLNTAIHGKLKNKGYLKRKQIDEKVLKELVDRSAHSKLFGGTTGFNFPKELVTKNASAEDIYRVARPYLEMNRMSAAQGLSFDKIVTEGKWNTPEELLDLVKANTEIDAEKTEALVKRMNVDLYEAGYVQPDGTTTIKGKQLTDQWGTKRGDLVTDPVSRGQTIAQQYEGQYHFPDEIEANGKAVLERQSRGWFADGSSKIGKLKLDDAAGNIRKGEALANIGTGLATGNPLQAVAGGAGLVLQSEATQKKMAALAAELVAKRASKTALKAIPGLDIGISGMEAWGYLKEGKLDQATLATLSGAVGWIPGAGDFASALIDSGNTALDIKRLSLHKRGEDPRRPKLDIEEPDFRLGRTLGRAL